MPVVTDRHLIIHPCKCGGTLAQNLMLAHQGGVMVDDGHDPWWMPDAYPQARRDMRPGRLAYSLAREVRQVYGSLYWFAMRAGRGPQIEALTRTEGAGWTKDADHRVWFKRVVRAWTHPAEAGKTTFPGLVYALAPDAFHAWVASGLGWWSFSTATWWWRGPGFPSSWPRDDQWGVECWLKTELLDETLRPFLGLPPDADVEPRHYNRGSDHPAPRRRSPSSYEALFDDEMHAWVAEAEAPYITWRERLVPCPDHPGGFVPG